MDYSRLIKALSNAGRLQFPIGSPVRFLGSGYGDSDSFRIGRVVSYDEGEYTIRFHDDTERKASFLELVEMPALTRFSQKFSWET